MTIVGIRCSLPSGLKGGGLVLPWFLVWFPGFNMCYRSFQFGFSWFTVDNQGSIRVPWVPVLVSHGFQFGFLFGSDVPIGMKLIVAAVYGGLAVLLFSVLRQRLIEQKTDKYKDVEI